MSTMAATVPKEVKDRFQQLDTNHDGILDFSEMMAFLRQGRASITEDEARLIFQACDKDNDGKIQLDEFMDYYVTHGQYYVTLPTPSPPPRPKTGPKTLDPGSMAGNQSHPLQRQRQKASSLPNLLSLARPQSGFGDAKKGSKAGGDRLPTPGPGQYNAIVKEHVPGGSYFGTCHQSPVPVSQASSLASEKRQFRRFDKDQNGVLDFGEVLSIMRKGNLQIQEVEVQALFQAVDKNGDGKIQFHELVEYLHPANGAFENSAWRKRLKTAFDMSGPGPADYVGNDKVQAHRTKAPNATFGTGPGHTYNGLSLVSPGPAFYSSKDKTSTKCKNGASATFGSGPGHLELSLSGPMLSVQKRSRSTSDLRAPPGPGTYDTQKSATSIAHLRIAPRATIGNSKRFFDDATTRPSTSPGPASYYKDAKESRGVAFGGPSRGHMPSLCALERRQFKKFDVDKNGTLSFEEVLQMMLKSDPKKSESEIRSIFDAIDKNKDGKIEFKELVAYLHPPDSDETSNPRKSLKIAMSLTLPGPADYDFAKAKKDRILGGAFGRATR
eukprot:TRINITY_DN17296_c0_g1_i1.p1 TRINITY_DN17296_c0_g1~~TRINITY_DN17296_c0_g1_i1.p1  ORF type:complete len:553 (+),score=114.71 TRINITY_DN17296_c0_g1_i1:150-1808(+)